jgi:transcriptional regulator with XRE-family HTH domain
MSTEHETPHIPQFTLGDRLTRSMRDAGIGVQDMATYLGVARNTVSTWLHDRITPNTQTLRLWALRTGVPLEWLQTGQCPHGDSNSEPTDYELEPSPFRVVA